MKKFCHANRTPSLTWQTAQLLCTCLQMLESMEDCSKTDRRVKNQPLTHKWRLLAERVCAVKATCLSAHIPVHHSCFGTPARGLPLVLEWTVAPDAPSPPQSRPPLPRAVAAPDPTPVQGSGSVHPSWWRKHQAEPKSWSLSFARSAHPRWNPTGFVYLLFCWPLLDQHQKRSSFPQPSCLLILSARHQQCKSPTLLFDICQGEDMPHNSQKQRLFQHCTIVRTDEAQFCPSEDGCCTHFSSLSAAVFERSFSACCRQWHHTPSWTTGGKILCCYKCKLQNRLVKIYLQQDLVAKTVILLPHCLLTPL